MKKTIFSLFALAGVALFLSSCDPKDVIDDLTTRYYFNFTFDGTAVQTGSGVNGSGASNYVLTDSIGVDSVSLTYGMAFTRIEGLQAYSIEFARAYEGPSSSELPAFHGHFVTGTYPYASATQSGINVTWRDTNGDLWESQLGDQTGSTFTVTEQSEEDNNASTGSQRHQLKGSLNCNVYRNGVSKAFTNATFLIYVESKN